MNDFDEFADIALTILLALTLLIWIPHLPRADAHRPRIPTPQPTESPTARLHSLGRMRCQPNQVRCHVAAAGVLGLGVLRNHSHITGDS
jgi:hypothetical protein